jgi:4-alpha-glucanotransferase
VNFPRTSGVLLHPTSLPSRFGIGDFGREAYRFVDFLAASRQSLWQVLPLGPTGYGDSPYQCYSAFAGNTLLISLEQLVTEGLLYADDLTNVPQFSDDRVDFQKAQNYKAPLLSRAFDNFKRSTNTGLRAEFETFNQQQSAWLEDYALFRALKDANGGAAWNGWEQGLVRREAQALAHAREELRDAIEGQEFYQFLFFKQWSALKAYCHSAHIKLVGDIPIFVAQDSADVWTHPDQFKLDENGQPLYVAGVPPDYFSATGQLWGNPSYNWERMLADGFHWWIERVKATLQLVDIIRIDHFRGFAAAWEIPGADKTAVNGHWVNAPGRELFATIRRTLGELPILAEDLGVITPDVEALRDDFGFPGMRILQFAFGGDAHSRDLPHNYTPHVVVYTGTHDNDTTVGWFESHAGEGSTRDAAEINREREFCLKYLDSDGHEIHWDMIRAALASVAETAIIPLQDVLGLGAEGRMNLPSTTSGNWNWRYRSHALTDDLSRRLKEMTEVYGRDLTRGNV